MARQNASSRILAEDARAIDVRDCPKLPGSSPQTPASASTVMVTIDSPDGRRTVAVRLLRTLPYFGGFRHWYACPECGKRVGRLYVTDARPVLACRRCHRLAYFCQYRKGAGYRLARGLSTGKFSEEALRVYAWWHASRARGEEFDWSLASLERFND